MALKVHLLDECVSGMHDDRESSYVTNWMSLKTLEYNVSLFCQNIYALTTSFDDGIMSN
jgi:hypothetical protein